jgi:hypothetical protein
MKATISVYWKYTTGAEDEIPHSLEPKLGIELSAFRTLMNVLICGQAVSV